MAETQRNFCLIGKILLRNHLNQSFVKHITQTEWKCKRDFSVSCIGHNIFTFLFEEKEDLLNVLQNGPWTINSGLLILTPWSSTKVPSSPDQIQFIYSGFWVQAHGLPFNDFIPENGSKIGSYLGVFVRNDYSMINNKFLRLRVILDITKPLISGFWFKQGIWVDLKYEKLGRFCYKCGRIGQVYMTCRFPHPPGNGSFGSWLRAWPVNGGNELTVLMPVLRKLSLVQSADLEDDIEEEMELVSQEEEEEVESISKRKLFKRFLINVIDSMAMVINCGVVFSRVTIGGGNWTFFVLVIAYLVHTYLKLIRVIKASTFLSRSSSGCSDLDNDNKPFKEFLILIVFLIMFLYF